jgi:histidine ammonia-lyase
MMERLLIDGNHLTIGDVVRTAREQVQVAMTDEAAQHVQQSRKVVDDFVEEERVVYGITTGFGKFSDVLISKEEAVQLQRNLIISHACGVGEPLPEEIVRGVMLLRANALSKGYSGVRLETIQVLLDMLNKRVHPVIPEKGSLGASGDLAPLAHMVLVMMGEGEAFYEGRRIPGAEAMEKAGITPVVLTSKEGLGLINGTQVMTAVGALCVADAVTLIKTLDIAGALTMEALRGITDAFDPRVHQLRPHAGQIRSAANILKITKDSERTTRQLDIRVQDAYTLRCIPQIHGASWDAILFVKEKVEIELNAVTDNPLIFANEKDAISGGNFHGQPVALAFDFLGIALSEVANVSERRIERMVNPQLSGLPAFLTKKGGLHSGLMIAQYSAAALVSENKVLAHPASVDSIPSSANQEDHVSMGTIGARKARSILTNAQYVVGIELMAACQAMDLGEDRKMGRGTKAVYETLRRKLPMLTDDRILYPDLETMVDLVRSGELVNVVENIVEAL